MADNIILEAIQKFLQDNVTSIIKLKKPNDKNVTEYSLVNPAVHIGWIPQKAYLPPEVPTTIPCILVSPDGGEDDGETSDITIRLSFVVWSPGLLDTDKKLIPNYDGYKDLLNFIDKTKHELITKRFINKETIVLYPIKWGMYEEQPYPYWYGYMTFKVKLSPQKYIDKDYRKYLE